MSPNDPRDRAEAPPVDADDPSRISAPSIIQPMRTSESVPRGSTLLGKFVGDARRPIPGSFVVDAMIRLAAELPVDEGAEAIARTLTEAVRDLSPSCAIGVSLVDGPPGSQ